MTTAPVLLRLPRHQVLAVRDHATVDAEWNLEWSTARLRVHDSIPGGRDGVAEVSVAWHSERVFLRAEAPLAKAEFETLFGFGRGEFVRGKCISLARGSVEEAEGA